MDEDMKNLLLAWNLENYIDVFAKNKISLDCLGLLDQYMIKELFPPIGDRALFTKNLENYKSITQKDKQKLEQMENETDEQNAMDDYVDMLSEKHRDPFMDMTNIEPFRMEPEVEKQSDSSILFTSSPIASTSSNISLEVQPSTSSTSNVGLEVQPSTSSTFILIPTEKYVKGQTNKKLLDLLGETAEGRAMLNMYREDGLLTSSARRKLCHIIITELLGDDPNKTTIPSSLLFEMACQIKEIFKKENISTYFIPYVNNKKLKIKRCAKGKLYDCLHNRKREHRLAEKKINKSASHLLSQCGETSEVSVVETNVSDDMAWIKASSEPWKLLEEKWKNTTKHRQKEAENMSISEYMAQYPGLKKPTGYHLLCIDFDTLYPEAKDKLFQKFMLSKKRIFELATRKFKCNASMNEMIGNMAEQHQGKENAEEAENITAFLILSLLTGQPMIKKTKKTCWRPSRQECRDGFITHVDRQMDLKETISSRKEKYLKYGATLQPSIFIVGENLRSIEQYFILVDNIFYTVANIVEAVDTCFKIYQALHCTYSVECETIWHFIQKGFYNITTPYDKEFVSVNSLLADLHLLDQNK